MLLPFFASYTSLKLLHFFQVQLTILLIPRLSLWTVLLRFFMVTSGIVIAKSKQVGQKKKAFDESFASLRSTHISAEILPSRS